MFDMRLLPAFVAVADVLHFGRAAERLNLAQPALSQQIRRLEQQLGFLLFERDHRSVELSDAGRAMLPDARLALASAQRAERAGRQAATGVQERLEISVNIDLPARVVERARELLAALDDVDVRVVRQHQGEGLRDLREGAVDVVLGWASLPGGAPLRAVPVASDELRAIVRSDHPLAGVGDRVTRKAFARHRFVMFRREQSPDLFDWMVKAATGQDRAGLQIDEIAPLDDGGAAMVSAAATGPGLGMLHTGVFERASSPFMLTLPFAPPVYHDITLTWRPEAETAAVRALLAAWTP